MFTTYKDMYDSIDDERKLIAKRLNLVKFANDNGIKVPLDFILAVRILLKNGVADMQFMALQV